MTKLRKNFAWLFCALCLCAAALLISGIAVSARADEREHTYELDATAVPNTVLSFAPVIANNMLYQAGKPVPVWGFAPQGSEIEVTLARQDGTGTAETKTVTADRDGVFETAFSAHDASYTEYVLTASDGTDTVTAQYILFGELFLSCGQSNMAFNVRYCSNADELKASATNPYIRVYMTPEIAGAATLPYYASLYWEGIEGGTWARGDNYVSIAGASAVSYNFAVDLFAKLNTNGAQVPVGFLNTAKGATSIEAWLSRASIEGDGNVRAYLSERNRLLSEADYNQAGSNNYNQVSAMFNSKIAPLSKMHVAGILWYQGENNVGNETAGQYYKNALSLVMYDWSKWFNGGTEDIPFLFAQITPHNYKYEQEALAYMWEGMAEAYTSNSERCAMVTTYDVPLDWYNPAFSYRSPIHPMVKQPVGERMADFAYNMLYGGTGATSSPVFDSVTFNGRQATVSFANAAGLKTTDGGDVRGFALCGANRVFYPAQAKINADGTLTLTSEWVKTPVAVTYAFSTMISYANLCSADGYPVAPFRSDKTASTYYHIKDWQNADALQHFVSEGSGTAENIAGMRDTYTASTTVALSVTDGFYGNALRLQYTLRGRESFWISPVLRQGNIDEQFAPYDTFAFRMRNSQARSVEIEGVEITLSDTRHGKLLRSDGEGTSATVAANSDYTLYSFSLDTMVTDAGNVDISSLRATITDIKIYCKDIMSGSLDIDEFVYGNIADYVTASDDDTQPSDPSGEQPGEQPKDDGTDGNGGTTVPEKGKKKCGCGSSVAATAGGFAGIAAVLAASAVLVRRKSSSRETK